MADLPRRGSFSVPCKDSLERWRLQTLYLFSVVNLAGYIFAPWFWQLLPLVLIWCRLEGIPQFWSTFFYLAWWKSYSVTTLSMPFLLFFVPSNLDSVSQLKFALCDSGQHFNPPVLQFFKLKFIHCVSSCAVMAFCGIIVPRSVRGSNVLWYKNSSWVIEQWWHTRIITRIGCFKHKISIMC